MRVILLCLALLTSPALAQPEKPAEEKKQPTAAVLKSAMYEHHRRTLVDIYNKSGKHDPKWDKAATAYLERACRIYAGIDKRADWPTLAGDGRALVGAAGCDDPMILAIYGSAADAVSHDGVALDALQRAVAGLQRSEYPATRLAVASALLGRHLTETDKAEQAAAPLQVCADACIEALSHAGRDPSERSRLYLELYEIYHDCLPETAGQVLIERAGKTAEVDPWLADTLAGVFYESQAWKLRGGGFADTVAPRDWQGFRERIALARERYERAAAAVPELPQPAAAMIQIAMVGGTGEDSDAHDWFEKATAAQFDNKLAYDSMLNALRPRWGGKASQMYGFGLHCAHSKRYDTDVPRYLANAVIAICEEGRDYERIWQVEGIYEELRDSLRGLIADPSHADTIDQDRTLLAVIAWRCGQFADAAELMTKLGAKFDREVAWKLRAAQGEMAEDIALYTGPAGDTYTKVRAEYAAENWTKARELMEQVAEASAGKGAELGDAAGEWLAITLTKEKFESGQWVDLRFSEQGFGWNAISGRWKRVDNGSVRATPTADGLICMLRTPVGMRWEMEGKLEFTNPGEAANAGVIFGYELSSSAKARWLSWLLRPEPQLAVARVGFTTKNGELAGKAQFKDGPNAFRVVVFDGFMSASVNGQTTYEGSIPRGRDRWVPGDQVGLGGYYQSDAPPVVYSELRIRKLTDPPAGADQDK